MNLTWTREGVLDAGRGDEKHGTRRAGLLSLLGSVYSFDQGRGGLIWREVDERRGRRPGRDCTRCTERSRDEAAPTVVTHVVRCTSGMPGPARSGRGLARKFVVEESTMMNTVIMNFLDGNGARRQRGTTGGILIRNQVREPVGKGGLRRGVLGTGKIASIFTRDLGLSGSEIVVAVGSLGCVRRRSEPRTTSPGRTRATRGSSPTKVWTRCTSPYRTLGTIRPALLALHAGNAVLVEKPFTVDARQAAELIALARERGVFLMEAMWTRFLPQFVHIRRLLGEERLGDVRLIVAEHGEWFAKDPNHRLFDPALAGGALLDLGVYVLSLASMVLGQPTRVHAVSDFTSAGVDAQTAIVLQYEAGPQAVLAVSMEATLTNRALIAGTEARLAIEGSWLRPTTFELTRLDGSSERFDYREEGSDHRYQAEEVARCVRPGLLESPVMPLDEALRGARPPWTEIRGLIGLSYPGM